MGGPKNQRMTETMIATTAAATPAPAHNVSDEYNGPLASTDVSNP
jgi:hypothetical protein